MWTARMMRALPQIADEYPNHRFISLVLTQKNCPYSELRATIDEMGKAWTRFTQLKDFPGLGFVKTLEITKGKDAPGMAHPHFHVLLMVKPSYFGGHFYVSKARWIEMWKQSARLDYDPSVWVAAVRAKRLEQQQVSHHTGSLSLPEKLQNVGMRKAVMESFKYITKPEDLTTDDGLLEAVITQLHGVRSTSIGGVFKNYMKASEPDDLVSDSPSMVEIENDTLNYNYCLWAGRYRLPPTEYTVMAS